MTAQTMARPMAVLPLLASSTILPGVSSPAASACSIIFRRDAVLDRAPGIQPLQFHQHLDAGDGVQAIDPHQRRVSNQLQNRIDFAGCHHNILDHPCRCRAWIPIPQFSDFPPRVKDGRVGEARNPAKWCVTRTGPERG